MRKYLKPAMEMEAFDVEDIITVSGYVAPNGGDNYAGAPADLDIDFN